MLKRIIFLRHAERSDFAPIERALKYDISHDPPLTELGHLEAQAAAEHIYTLLPKNSSIKLVSSPMLRCVQTMSKLANILDYPIYLQLGFGEAFPAYIENPFENLYINTKKNDFPINVEPIEEIPIILPKIPESFADSTYRMKMIRKHYMPYINSEYLIICTHLYPIWGMIHSLGEKHDEQNTHFAQITEFEYACGEYVLKVNGYYRHLAQLYDIE